MIQSIEEEVLDGEKADVQYRYTLATNTIAMDVAFGDMEAISELDGVSCVYVAPTFTVDPLMSSASQMEEVAKV